VAIIAGGKPPKDKRCWVRLQDFYNIVLFYLPTPTYNKMKNKIIQGDCLEEMNKLEDNSVDLVVTSPPYNIGIEYGDSFLDTKPLEEYKKWILEVYMQLFRVIKKGGLVCINVGNQRNSGLPHHTYFLLKEAGFDIIKEIFWYKGLYYIQGETIFVCSKGKEYNKYYQKGDGFYSNGQFSTVWEMRYKTGESKKKLGHNAFFVKQLPYNFIKINTKEGDVVLDPFMGSGTTGVACAELRRKFIGIELNKEYIKIAKARIKPYLEQKKLF